MPIPIISKSTYDLANQCALLLWHGISYEIGKQQPLSDAAILEHLSGMFLKELQGKRHKLITKAWCADFAKTTGLGFRFKRINPNVANGNRVLFKDIVNIYNTRIYGNNCIEKYAYAAQYNRILGEALATRGQKNGNVITFASRMLFFAIPSELGFNLNEEIAVNLGYRRDAPSFNMRYCADFANALKRDWSMLVGYKMPCRTNEISQEVWDDAYKNGWWQRRVLDIAVLIQQSPSITTYVEDEYLKLKRPKAANPFKKG